MLDSTDPPAAAPVRRSRIPMRVTLAVPDLLAADRATLARSAALARVAAYAAAAPVAAAEPDAALVAAAGMPPDTPLAPLAAAGAGFAPGAVYVLRADPVALVAGRDDVLLAGRVDDLTPTDAAALAATLAAHFAPDGLAFHVPRPDAWFVTVRGDARPDTTPLALVRDAIGAHLPRGPHGALWRRWLSEMQMLLHGHPVNAAREARGQAPVTGIWISCGGTLPPPRSANAAGAIHAAPGRPGDVARGIARARGADAPPPPADYAALATGGDAVVVLPPLAGAQALPALERAWLAPALAALERGHLAALTLVAGDGVAAWTWSAARPPVTRRIGARLAPRAFAVPTRDAA